MKEEMNKSIQAKILENKRVEEALREEKGFYKAFQFNPIPTTIRYLADARYVDVNEAYLQLSGFVREEVIGRTEEELNAIYKTGTYKHLIERVKEGKPVRNIENQYKTKDGRIYDLLVSIEPIELAGETCVITTALDITERKRAEEIIRQQSERAQLEVEISQRLVEAGLDYERVLDAITRQIAELIGDACGIFQFPDGEQQSIPVAFHHRDSRARAIQKHILQKWTRGINSQFDRTIFSGDIIYIPVVDPQAFRAASTPDIMIYLDQVGVASILVAPLRAQSRVIGYLAITRDKPGHPYTLEDQILLQNIAARAALTIQNANLYKQVQGASRRLQALSAQQTSAQEAERRTIARELHDEFGQILSGLMMQLGIARSQLPKSARSVDTILEGAEELTREMMDRTRAIIIGLRPQVLDDLGLIPALHQLAGQFQENTGTKVEIKVDGSPDRLPEPLEVALFRIAQEGLTNVRKHAQARQVTIELMKQDGRVVLSLQDDGLGFEKQPAGPGTSDDMVLEGGWRIPAGHFGLVGIQERAAQLGGKLSITTAPGQGTTLRVEIPMTESLFEEKAGSHELL